MGQIPTGAEDHQALWSDDTFLPESNPEGIGDGGAHRALASDAGLDPERQRDTRMTDGSQNPIALCCQPKKKTHQRWVLWKPIWHLIVQTINRFRRASGLLS